MTKDNWIKAFDKKYLQLEYCGDTYCEYEGKDKCFHGTEDDIKDFIQSQISLAEKRKDEEWMGGTEKSILDLQELMYPVGKYGVRKTTTHNQAIALCIGKLSVSLSDLLNTKEE